MKTQLSRLKHSPHRNQQGFSMVSVVMAFGMLGGLALALAKLSTQQMGLQKKIESHLELNALNQQIGRTIYDQTSCIRTIKKDASGSQTRFTTGRTIVLKHIKNKNGKKVFRKNYIYGNGLIKIVALSLKDIVVNGTAAEANLHITFEKISKTIKGYKKADKIFPLSVELNASRRPISCSSDLNASIDTAKKQICEDFGTYDPTTETCRSSMAVQCAEGQVVTGFGADGGMICNTLSAEDPHPTGYNCYLLANYIGGHGLYGEFQPVWANRNAQVGLNRWMHCPFGTSGVTSCNTVFTDETDPLTCPTGYTSRYVMPTTSVNSPQGGAYLPVSSLFLMEHHCCK